jgi:hypothetical protein
MSQLNLPLWTKGVMAAFICFHSVIEITLALYLHRQKVFGRQAPSESQDFLQFINSAVVEWNLIIARRP